MPVKQSQPIDGVLLLDKPAGLSSNQALQKAKRIFCAKKAGYTGTLDPFATGLLPVCFGQANKYARWMSDADKTYRFVAQLGQATDTGDKDGEIIATAPIPSITEAQLSHIEKTFTGFIEQIPPKYSALKVDGVRAYQLAREGVDFSLTTRRVEIKSLTLSIQGTDKIVGQATVSKGTYIRTLVTDIACALQTVAYCQSLRRLKVGHLGLLEENSLIQYEDDRDVAFEAKENNRALSNQLITLDTLSDMPEEARYAHLLPLDTLCQQFTFMTINASHWHRLIQGKTVMLSDNLSATTCLSTNNAGNEDGTIVRLYLAHQFCGLGTVVNHTLRAFRLMDTSLTLNGPD